MGENDLIIKARQGNSAAFMQLYHKYQPVVYRLQRKYYLKDLEADDWRQEGQIVFFKTLRSFDLTLGVSLGYFFKLNFQRHIFSLLRRQSAEKRKTEVYSSSLEAALENKGEGYLYQYYKQEDLALGYVIIREQLSGFNELLSLMERAVWDLYLENYENDEIAAALKIELAQVNNAIDRVKSKLKLALK